MFLSQLSYLETAVPFCLVSEFVTQEQSRVWFGTNFAPLPKQTPEHSALWCSFLTGGYRNCSRPCEGARDYSRWSFQVFLSLARGSFLTCVHQFLLYVGSRATLSRYLGFSVSAALSTLLLCPRMLDALINVFLTRGDLPTLPKSPVPAAWPGNNPCSVRAVVGLISLVSCLLWSLTTVAFLFRVLRAIGSHSSSFSVVPGRRVNPVCVSGWLEADRSPHCGFSFLSVITEVEYLFTCGVT